MKNKKKIRKMGLVGLSILSQFSFALAKPIQTHSARSLDLTVSPSFFSEKATQSAKMNILDLLNQAIDNDPELAMSVGEITSALYNAEAEHNRRYGPIISLGAGVSYVQLPPSGWQQQIGISFNLPLWNVPQDILIKRAAVDLSVSEIDNQIRMQELLAKVVAAYFGVLKANEKLAVGHEIVAAYEAYQKDLEEQLEVGLISKTDVDAVKLFVEQEKSNLIDIVAEQGVAGDTLAAKWFVSSSNLAVLKKNIEFTHPEPKDPKKWKEIMLASSLIFQRDAKNIEGLNLDIKKEKAALYMPTINLTGGYSYQGASNPTIGDQNGGYIGLTYNQVIFNNGYTNSKAKALAAKKNIARDELDKDLRSSALRVDTALRRLEATLFNIKAYGSQVKNAESVVAQTREDYRNGIRSSSEVLNVIRQNLAPAKLNLLNAKYEYFTQEIELKLAAGTLSIVDILEINSMFE